MFATNGVRLFSAAASFLFMAVAPARAEFPSKNIDLVIPYEPGGGFDLYARAVAAFMPKYLGGDVKILPRNIPGGAAVKGLTNLFHAPQDGYTFGIVPLPGGLQPQLIGQRVEYDLDQLTWLGVVNIAVYNLVVAKNSPYKSLNDFLAGNPRIPFIATTGTNDDAMIKIVMSVLHAKAKYLSSFRGAPETQLAVIRGEADAALSITETVAGNLASGDLRQLVWFQRKAAAGAPANVPSADDIGHPELANIGLYRVFAAPPGLDSAVRDKLASALQQTLQDKEFLSWSARSGFPIDAGDAGAAKRLYQEQRLFLSKYVDQLKDPGKAP